MRARRAPATPFGLHNQEDMVYDAAAPVGGCETERHPLHRGSRHFKEYMMGDVVAMQHMEAMMMQLMQSLAKDEEFENCNNTVSAVKEEVTLC